MKFKTITGSGSEQLFFTLEEGKYKVIKNIFTFTGFSNGIHPYNRKRINWIVDVLKTGGIVLSVVEVATCDDMTEHEEVLEFGALKIPPADYAKSTDGNTYILFQDTEMGRGWACLIKNTDILIQDHRDNILDTLEAGEFIRSFGIDYEAEFVDDIKDVISFLRQETD